MLIEEKIVTSLKIKKKSTKVIFVLECDECHILFERRGSQKYKTRKHHFCSKRCYNNAMKEGGSLRNYMEMQCLEKYGVTCNLLVKDADGIEKRKRTWQTNGYENPSYDEVTKLKREETSLKNNGVRQPLSSKEVRKKSVETWQHKYNTDNPAKVETIMNSIKQTNLERYGAECYLASTAGRLAAEDTCLKKYGVKNPMDSDIVKAKFDWVALHAKGHETMKKNGTYGKSKIEDEFYAILSQRFSSIERYVRPNNQRLWRIDFYIEDIDTYVQFDGEYWHGLDRPLEIIQEFRNKRDSVIYKKYCDDREQDKWFKENKLKLIRITDVEFSNLCRTNKIDSYIIEHLER
mgnify:CR=1 FL=1